MQKMMIHYETLDSKNFDKYSLDNFVRHQQVRECWRNVDGQWRLIPMEFEENWSLKECREIAADVALHMGKDQTAYGAFDGGKVVGFVTVSHNMFGNTAKYVELVCFQVSEPYRGIGMGKALFYKACEEAKDWARISCTFRHIRLRKVRRHTAHSDAFMQRRLTVSSLRRSRVTCSLSMSLTSTEVCSREESGL